MKSQRSLLGRGFPKKFGHPSFFRPFIMLNPFLPMSDETPKPPSEEPSVLDLSGLNFGPAWAKSDSSGGSSKKQYKDYEERPSRRGDRKGGPSGQSDRGRDNRRSGGGGQNRGGNDRGRNDRGGRNDRFNSREREPRRNMAPVPEGITGLVMPREESLDKLASEITSSGRTYSIFDLAKFLLQGRDRYQINFQAESERLVRCTIDNSLWLSPTEAARHLWQADWRPKYYEEVPTEADPPKGSFQAVAKCGLSGTVLGPPNYHDYQTNLAKLHRERFGNMPLEALKSKIVMERGEEVVQAWLDSMTTVTHWRPLDPEADQAKEALESEKTESAGPDNAESETAAPLEAEPSSIEEPKSEVETTIETNPTEESAADPVVEGSAENASGESKPDEESPETPAETGVSPVPEAPLLTTPAEVEAHFQENHFGNVFQTLERAWVPGDIQAKLLSPGLLTLLKETLAEERRYPGKLSPILCRQLSGRHLAVYKWQKKLKAGPSRPRTVPADITLSDRPASILAWLHGHQGKKLKDLWEAILPPEATEEIKRDWFQDLHWLLNEGYLILLSDSSIHLSKTLEKLPKSRPKKSSKKKSQAEKATPAQAPLSSDTPSAAADKPTEPEAGPTAETHPAEPAPAESQEPPAEDEAKLESNSPEPPATVKPDPDPDPKTEL